MFGMQPGEGDDLSLSGDEEERKDKELARMMAERSMSVVTANMGDLGLSPDPGGGANASRAPRMEPSTWQLDIPEQIGYASGLHTIGPSQTTWQPFQEFVQSGQQPLTNVVVPVYSDHGAVDATTGNVVGPQPTPYPEPVPQSPPLLYRPGDSRLGQLSAHDFHACVAENFGLEDSSRCDFTDVQAFFAHCRDAFFDAFSKYSPNLATHSHIDDSAPTFTPEGGTTAYGTADDDFDMTSPAPMSMSNPQPLPATFAESVHPADSSNQQTFHQQPLETASFPTGKAQNAASQFFLPSSNYSFTADQIVDSVQQPYTRPIALEALAAMPHTPSFALISPKKPVPRPATQANPNPATPFTQKASPGHITCDFVDDEGIQCPRRFRTSKERNRHGDRDHYKARYKCEYPGCGKYYARTDACTRHWKKDHPLSGPSKATATPAAHKNVRPGRAGRERQNKRRTLKEKLRHSQARGNAANAMEDGDDEDEDRNDDEFGPIEYEDAEEDLYSDATEGLSQT